MNTGSFAIAKPKKGCGRCGKNPQIHGIEYCSHCLTSIVEKRVRTSLKAAMGKIHSQSRQPQPTLKLNIISDDRRSLDCAATLYLVKNAIRADFPLHVAFVNPKEAARVDNAAIIIFPQCSDDVATGLIRQFISSPQSSQPHSSGFPEPINILESITEKELELYADMKKIKYEHKNKDVLQQAVEKLQERHPGTVEAIAKSAAHLRKIEDKDKNEG